MLLLHFPGFSGPGFFLSVAMHVAILYVQFDQKHLQQQRDQVPEKKDFSWLTSRGGCQFSPLSY